MKKETGGPAFPREMSSVYEKDTDYQHFSDEQDGMTLRDYFAGEAMQGFCSKPFPPDKPFAEWCSQMSYEIADAMLKERERP